MPQPFNNAVMTNAGAWLLTRAQAGEVKIQFTRIATGNGTYSAAEKTLAALQARTALKTQKNSYPLSDVDIFSEYSVKVTALITNLDPVTREILVTQGYYINEMGLYAKPEGAPDSAEVLYSITVTTGENGDFMPPYNGYSPVHIIQGYFVTVNNSADVTIVTENAIIPADELKEVVNNEVDRMLAAPKETLSILSNKVDNLIKVGGEPNKIEKIKVNDTEQLVDTTDKSVNIAVPTKTSQLKNDDNYQTETQTNNKISAHNDSQTSHGDIRELITGLTSRLNGIADSDDTTLDQLSEIVAYIKSNKTLIDNITTSKVSKEPGKGLSTNDYTDDDKYYIATLPLIIENISSQVSGNANNISITAKTASSAYSMVSDLTKVVGSKMNKTPTTVDDWNDATETGFYVCTSENTSHNPAPLLFFGIVISLGDNRVIQILYNYKDVSVPSGIQVVFTRLGKKVDNGTFVWLPFADRTKKPNSKDDDGIVSKGSGHADKVWKTDASGNPGWRDDADTTYNVASKTANGLVPKLPNESTVTKFLRQDGTWSAPTVPANESGVWTPKVCYNNAGALTELSASDKKGFYVKTGRLVYLKGFVTLSSMFNSEYYYIQGLPLAKNNNADNFNLETGNAYFLSGNAEIPKNLTPYKADGISFFSQNTLTLYKNTDTVTTALCFTIVYVSYT